MTPLLHKIHARVVTSVHMPWNLLRQSPRNDGVWGPIQLIINNEKGCSWLYVQNHLPHAPFTTMIPNHRRILHVTEPTSIVDNHPDYLNQFGIVLSPYPRPSSYQGAWLEMQPATAWYYGLDRTQRPGAPRVHLKWDEIAKPKKKTKNASILCSRLDVTPFQQQRLRFATVLKEELSTQIDFYGRDDNFIADKADAIDPYRYHIALENNQDKHFWSEKLADCYLGESYPIHAGCDNLCDYFPEQAYTSIDIFNIPQAIQQVKDIIASDLYEKNKTYILEAKRRVMEEYNILAVLQRVCERAQPTPDFLSRAETIQPDTLPA